LQRVARHHARGAHAMTLVLFGFALGYLVGLAAQRFIDDYRRG
jgi:hypothetical protein